MTDGVCPDCGNVHEQMDAMEVEEAIAALKAAPESAKYPDEVVRLAVTLARMGVIQIGRGRESGKLIVKMDETAQTFMDLMVVQAMSGQSVN